MIFVRNSMCTFFGHNMYFDTANAAGTATCKRCGHKDPAIVWPHENNTVTKYKKENSKSGD